MIHAEGLCKEFRTPVRRPGLVGAARAVLRPEYTVKHAVRGLSFSVAAGELIALLGPNGAGKSTTLKIMTGILHPSSGRITVRGRVPHADRVANARVIGAVFGQRSQLWWDLPALESLRILKDIYEVDDAAFKLRIRELDDLLDLSAYWNTRVRHLSLGQRVRCDLAAALLHDPEVLFLDEPTIGMDVVVKEQVRDFLRFQVAERGRTVVLTTHDMTEVGRLAQRVLLINHGRLVFDGDLAVMKAMFGGAWQIEVTLANSRDQVEVDGLTTLRRNGAIVTLGPCSDQHITLDEAVQAVIRSVGITNLSVEEDDLEDVMRKAYLADGSGNETDISAVAP
ncbi:ATP-binding cassette domain-containing protein [Streptomyces sp. NPDC091217]|uniref:ABC transporter ATP-binding protein n=1 Tax=Streptomyces sp. NPDC091217 TaxID=3365975 RepID=UPI0038065DED